MANFFETESFSVLVENHYSGPMDLLLHLVKKEEVAVVELPIAKIADQFIAHLEVLEELDIASAGEFIGTASTLIELKSQELLPSGPLFEEEGEEEVETPREALIRNLLAYKEYRDAANTLTARSLQWQRHYARQSVDLVRRKRDPANEEIREVELWDLVSAFGRILRANDPAPGSNIVYDDTPISTFMQRIHNRLKAEGSLCFNSLFEAGMHKSTLVGLFCGMLELSRHYDVVIEQNEIFGEIWIYLSSDDDWRTGKEVPE